MDIPITVAWDNYEMAVKGITNRSPLPARAKMAVLKQLYESLYALDRQELARDKRIYQQALEAENADKRIDGDNDG